MNQSTVYWMDKNLGRPLCFFLTLHKRFWSRIKKRGKNNGKVSKILFIKLIEQGSTVLAYSALKKAVDMVGEKNVYFMVFKENRFILDILDVIPQSNILSVDFTSFTKFVFSLMQVLRKIREEKIDSVIDMEFFSRASAILSYLSGAPKRVGLHLFTCEGPYRGNLFNYRLLYNPYLHTSQFFLSLVEALNHRPPDKGPLVFKTPENNNLLPMFLPSEDEKKLLIQKIEKLKKGSLTKPIIIFNPNASDLLPIRKWPERYFIRLGKLILGDYSNATLIITGAPEEKEHADRIASQIKNAVSLAGHSSLRELLTLYCIGDVLITNDSGPAHFSALTPVKSIILFGPETTCLYGPLGNHAEVITPNLVCSPCVNVFNHRKSPCNYGYCMESIAPEEVFKKIGHFFQLNSVERILYN